MYKQLNPQRWTCAKCLQRLSRVQQRRQNTTAAATATGTASNAPASSVPIKVYAPYWTSDVSQSQDDRTLRDVFDSEGFWQSFSRPAATKTAGLVQNIHIKTADGFHEFTIATLAKCKRIVRRVLGASSPGDYRCMAKDLDQLSDLLCRVIDLSDFMRSNHPDQRFVDYANRAYAAMFEYMNELNTNAGLNEQLKKAFSMPEVIDDWSEEEKIVGRILMKEFSNSAIDLPDKERRRFVDLSNDIAALGNEFMHGVEPADQILSLDANKLHGLDPTIVKSSRRWNGKVAFHTYSYESYKVLNFAHDEDVRHQVHTAQRTSSRRQIHRLEELLRKRAELADLSGHQSYAHMTLADKMAKSPEAVNRFLTTLNSTNKTTVETELSRLSAFSRGAAYKPWNYGYYLRQAEQAKQQDVRTSKSRHLQRLTSYFSLGTVMQGISRLFSRLYGVRLVARETPSGETWSQNVRRLDVIHETDGPLAVIYCDLFSRPNKSPNPAHFTLRCSREITDEEQQNPSDVVNDGMPTTKGVSRITGKPVTYQLPVIALVCDFARPNPGTPPLLPLHSVITLFHEMGHAIHSILGRTSLQSISGTRCPTDFAELPSVLMESFAVDPTVLSLYARHYSTNEPLTPEMISILLSENASRASFGGAIANESQILMSFLDQAYHSLSPTSSPIDSTAMCHHIYAAHSSLDPEPPTTSWQGSFTHLYGYGSTYYSYLFDRAIARRVWQQIFKSGKDQGAIHRESGEKFKNAVLRWGGGRDPWICLEDLLGNGDGVLADGTDKAMLEVGKWGVGVGEGDAVGL